jgi:hypothetical protein
VRCTTTVEGCRSATACSSAVRIGDIEELTAVGADRRRQDFGRRRIDRHQHHAIERTRQHARADGRGRVGHRPGIGIGLQLDHQPLGGAEHVDTASARPLSRHLDDRVDTGVVAQRIVVVERKASHLAGHREIDRELDRTVAPAAVLVVFAERELGIVDQQVGAFDEVGIVAFVGALRRPLAVGQVG